jgi:hypothetical protein
MSEILFQARLIYYNLLFYERAFIKLLITFGVRLFQLTSRFTSVLNFRHFSKVWTEISFKLAATNESLLS